MKTIRKIVFIFLLFIVFTSSVSAAKKDLDKGSKIQYGNVKINDNVTMTNMGGIWETFYYTADVPVDNDKPNAFCVEPVTPSTPSDKYEVTDITNDSKYKKLKKALYYSKNYKRFSKVKSLYKQKFCGGEDCGGAIYFAYSSVILSYYYYKAGNDNGWPNILSTEIRSGAESIAKTIDKKSAPPSTFHVYLMKTKKQDIVFGYEEKTIPKACARVVKKDSATGEYLPGATIELSKGSNHTVVDTVIMDEDGVTFNGLDADTTYYIKETNPPDNYRIDDTGYKVLNKAIVDDDDDEDECPLNTFTDTENTPQNCCIKITKKSGLGSDAPLIYTPVSFELHYEESGVDHKIGPKDTSYGVVSFSGLDCSKDYTIKENFSYGGELTDQNGVTRKYYSGDTHMVFSSELTSGSCKAETINNIIITKSITFRKVDENNNPLNDAVFAITHCPLNDDGQPSCGDGFLVHASSRNINNTNGIVTVSFYDDDINRDTYYVTEIIAPKDSNVNSTPKQMTTRSFFATSASSARIYGRNETTYYYSLENYAKKICQNFNLNSLSNIYLADELDPTNYVLVSGTYDSNKKEIKIRNDSSYDTFLSSHGTLLLYLDTPPASSETCRPIRLSRDDHYYGSGYYFALDSDYYSRGDSRRIFSLVNDHVSSSMDKYVIRQTKTVPRRSTTDTLQDSLYNAMLDYDRNNIESQINSLYGDYTFVKQNVVTKYGIDLSNVSENDFITARDYIVNNYYVTRFIFPNADPKGATINFNNYEKCLVFKKPFTYVSEKTIFNMSTFNSNQTINKDYPCAIFDGFDTDEEYGREINYTYTLFDTKNASLEKFVNTSSVLNWYKETEKGSASKGAKFSVKNSNGDVIRHEAQKETYTDASSPAITKDCYKFSSSATASAEFVSDDNGDVCIIGLNNDETYTITETVPSNYHTFDNKKTINLTPSNVFMSKNTNNKFINYPTEFEFTKEVVGSYGVDPDRTTVINELKKLRFRVKSGSTTLNFILKDGVYEYSPNEIDGVTGNSTTDLQLQDEVASELKMKLTIKHLPVGTYTIEEINEGCTTSLGNACNGSGMYLPDPVSFTITNNYNSKVTATMTNVMTELTFTKSDIYSYEDPSDKVKFENNEEIKLFDDISFKLKDENGKYLNVTKLGDVGSCSSTSGYANYFYNPAAEGDGQTGTVLHTCGGNLKIENLCRNRTYTIEEVEVPNGSVFILPTTHPTVSKTISEKGTLSTNSSNTVTISDTPTRVVLQKLDSRNNSQVVNDQSATFEVYRCKKNETTCTTSTAAEKMHFIDKVNINSELAYKVISSSDITSGISGTTTLKLNSDGKIIIRYLPANYSYIFVETNAPKGFYQLTESLGKINFNVLNNSSDGTFSSLTNYPTSIKLTKEDIYRYYKKTDLNPHYSNVKEFDKIKFRLYDKNGNLVRVTKVQNGEYKYYNDDGTATGTISDMNTLNGEITITHLDRNSKYYIEENNVDDAKEFILPNNINNNSLPGNLGSNHHPIVSYTIGETTSTANPAAISNMIENLPTRVVFKKIDLNTGEDVRDLNQVATFNVYQCSLGTTCRESNGRLLKFEDAAIISGDTEDVFEGVTRKAYKYVKSDNASGVTDLKLDDKYLVLRYLPTDYSYVLVETSAPDGYYNPPSTEKYTEFSVLSTTLDNGETYALPGDVKNTPVEITFTKEDFYRYMDASDKIDFENEDEVKAFDDITFNLKDARGNVIELCKKGTETVDGKEINVYRYLNSTCSNRVRNIHTKNGKLKITHLYRSTTYDIEEIAVPNHSVFTLPLTNTSVTYSITAEGNVSTNRTNTKVLNDVPTRVLIYKKDDRTNNNIRESEDRKQTATFELYRCSDTTVDCIKDNTNEKVTFMKRAVLTRGDIQNDNSITDGDMGRKAYKFVSTSDLNGMSSTEKRNLTTTTLELDEYGQILLRYLPANYKYVLVETNAPDGYYNYVAESLNDEISIDVINNGTEGTVYNFVDAHTEIIFNKDDIYKYYKKSDLAKLGENTKIFDSMTFVLRNQDGEVVKLTKEQDGEYRFIQPDGSHVNNTITNLHPKDGTFVITHLYRNETYYIEEIKTDTEGNFILPNNIDNSGLNLPASMRGNKHPIVKYNIPNIIPDEEGVRALTQLVENRPSRVVFEKRDAKTGELIDDIKNDIYVEDDDYKDMLTTFEVYQCSKNVEHCTVDNGSLVNFEEREYNQDLTNDINEITNPIYVYKYKKLNEGGITSLHTDRGLLVLSYLPSDYKYVLYETVAPNGYHNPRKVEAQTEFEVKSTTLDSGETYEVLTERVSNTPTEIHFTKKDLYDYYDKDDLSKIDSEVKIFDSMDFILRNKEGQILKLKCSDNYEATGEKNEDRCRTGEYRYVPIDSNNTIERMHTKDGNIKITHLYRDEVYYIEEVKQDTEGNFILPDYLNYNEDLPFNPMGHPVVKYTLPENESADKLSVTEIMNNIPSRIMFQKRDSKYNYLIPDERTTFNVYQCDIDVEKCTPEVGRIINFEDRGVITGDQEDQGKEVYKYKKLNQGGVTDLHPYLGELILRYLPTKYKYVLVETVSPQGYMLPEGEHAYTYFTLSETKVDVEEVQVPNKPVSLLIRKYAQDGELLEGATFNISKAKNCNAHVKPNKVERLELIKLKTIRDGVYEARPTGDTTLFKTCKDKLDMPCNQINSTLTYPDYETEVFGNSMGDFEKLVNSRNEKINIEAGEALIQYLDYGGCYIIEEVKAPTGYSLPEKEEDRFVMVKMTDKEMVLDTYEELVNTPTPFTFFKLDDYNGALDGGKYKLQKLNRNKIYEDVKLTKEVKENGEYYYKVNQDGEYLLMETKDGKATISYLEEGQYRVLEVESPPGYELPKQSLNVVTFLVDQDGKVYGSSIIANKPKTEKKEALKPKASATFVLNVDTGQQVVRYGLIIGVLLSVILGLILISKKRKGKSE